MIIKVKISNFRSIKTLDIKSIGNTLAFIGENSSGKSSIMSAMLLMFDENKVKDSDFRINRLGNRENELFVGMGFKLDYFSIKRIIIKYETQEKKPRWYSNISKSLELNRRRNIFTNKYISDFKKKLKETLNIQTNDIYFKLTYTSRGHEIVKMIELTDLNFNMIESTLDENNIKDILSIIRPRHAYLKDERDFLIEKTGEVESTTNKLFNLLLPSMNNKIDLGEKNIEDIPISQLSIPLINQYLLSRVKNEAMEITKDLNENFKNRYNEDIAVEWHFSNQLFESLNIKTNFKLTNNGTYIDFQSIGSGTRSLYKIVLLQTLLEKQKNDDETVIFFLEEPELYLYPKLEKNISEFITEISKHNQVIITTHSHMPIINLDKKSVYKVFRKDINKSLPNTKINKISSPVDILNILGYDITYFLGKEYLIFVEGKDDKKSYEYLVEKIFPNQVVSNFMTMTSVSKLHMAVNLSFLQRINSSTKSVYIIDSDGGENLGQINKIKSEIAEHDNNIEPNSLDEKIIVTKFCMLECYTFEYELLKNPISQFEYNEKIKNFIENNKEDINKLLIKRKKQPIGVCNNDNINEIFNDIKMYGLNKKLVKSFNREIGGSGFKKIYELTERELTEYCGSLVSDLKRSFRIDTFNE